MQITHQEARHLIHYRADQPLELGKKELLNAHLRNCEPCTVYANEIQETEATLRTILRKHWNMEPSPLQVMDINVKVNPYPKSSEFLATRSAVIGMAVMVFFFVFWQFTSTHSGIQTPVAMGVPVIPTPSLPMTSTQNTFANCQMVQYEVRRNDTVKSLARKFRVSEDVIRELNSLQANDETLPSLLIIPACESTPTGTTYPPTATTNTPSLELVTYTPG